MATINVSDDQKVKIMKAVDVVSEALGSKQSQADIVDMGTTLLLTKYTES